MANALDLEDISNTYNFCVHINKVIFLKTAFITSSCVVDFASNLVLG